MQVVIVSRPGRPMRAMTPEKLLALVGALPAADRSSVTEGLRARGAIGNGVTELRLLDIEGAEGSNWP